MNESLFDANVSVLKACMPDIAQQALAVSMEGFPVEIISTKSGVPSARITTPESGKPVLLHSAYDPVREAKRWAEGLDISEPTNVVVLGIGLGYHLLTLLTLHESNLRYLILIETDARILRLALSAVDLRRILSRKGTVCMVGEAPAAIPELIGEKRADFILHNCRILEHEPSVRCYTNYYRSARESIIDALTYDEINLRTTFENHGRNQFNIFMNLPAIFHGCEPNDCKGLMEGYPAVVSAAGPSLDKNVAQLRDLEDQALLIIVDTAQKTFRRHGITPHVIVTADPTPLNFSHFEEIDQLGNAFLAFHPEVNRQITQKYTGHSFMLPLFDGESEFLHYLFDAEQTGCIPRAMNVGHIAFNLARHLGCAPIVLAGFDLAFPREGGRTHAADAALSRRLDAMQADGTVGIGGKEGKAPEESGRMMLVPGYYENMVPTTVPFSQYIKALERTVEECPFEVIDATEGGAAFAGTLRMPMHQALRQTLKTGGVAARLDALRRGKRTKELQSVLERMEHGRQVLAKGRRLCDRMNAMLREWKRMISQQPIDRREAEGCWQAFDKIWLEMVGDPLFDAFLGSSPQYLYFRRQRTEKMQDQTGNAYLLCLFNKYTFIIGEMTALLDHFLHCVDLSMMSLKTSIPR
ncbi:MAG: DUF115 domain-containing protein [Candidatus Omnitrophota bacterium]|nr:MAG: DUF115 domain-containing protein [Candidatus Omnitrophota bacterium]